MSVPITFAFSSSQSIAFCNITSIYNSRVYEPCRRDMLPDDRKMFGIFLPIEGNTFLVLRNGERLWIKKHSLAFVMVSDLATVYSDDNGRHCINYWFMAHGINLPVNKIFQLDNIDEQKEISFANEIIELVRTQNDYNVQYANAKFTCRVLEWLNLINKATVSKSKDAEIVDKAIVYINDNITKGLTVKDLAQQFNYCEKHFRNLFKKSTGVTPKQFIDNVRLDSATTLLTTTQLSLQEISDRLCFVAVSHFISCFKAKYGSTPTEYRKLLNNYILPST